MSFCYSNIPITTYIIYVGGYFKNTTPYNPGIYGYSCFNLRFDLESLNLLSTVSILIHQRKQNTRQLLENKKVIPRQSYRYRIVLYKSISSHLLMLNIFVLVGFCVDLHKIWYSRAPRVLDIICVLWTFSAGFVSDEHSRKFGKCAVFPVIWKSEHSFKFASLVARRFGYVKRFGWIFFFFFDVNKLFLYNYTYFVYFGTS